MKNPLFPRTKGDTFWIGATFLVGALALFQPLNFYVREGSVLSRYSLISPDGFDWIIEGRALVAGVFEGWPVLRNPGYVFIAGADSLLGGHGLAIAISTSLAIGLQFGAIVYFLRIFHVAWYGVFAVELVFVLSSLQFITTYVLSDPIATAGLAMSAVFLSIGLQQQRFVPTLLGSISAAVAALFQLYGFAAAIVAVLILVTQILRRKIGSRIFLSSSLAFLGAFLIYLVATYAWTHAISFESRPKQIEFLQLSNNMFGFYKDLWSVLMLPWVLLFIYGAVWRAENRLFNYVLRNVQFVLLAGVVILLGVFAYLYQWPESRFTYSFLWAIAAAAGVFAFGSRKPKHNNAAITMWVVIGVVFSSVFTPLDFWRPAPDETQSLNLWWESAGQGGSNYAWYELELDLICGDGRTPNLDRLNQAVERISAAGDSYATSVARFGWANCLR